jgi:hypothetical protein
MIAMSAEQVASQVDFDAMFGRVEQGWKAAPSAGLLDRVTLWVTESLQHNPIKVWAPVGGFAVAAAVLMFVLSQSGGSGAEQTARRGVIAEERAPKRERVMVAQTDTPKAKDIDPAESNASEVVQVDFGSNTGTVFEIALADGASTPVVWINDEE